jgi:hypothetical protein
MLMSWEKLYQICKKGWHPRHEQSSCTGPIEAHERFIEWLYYVIDKYQVESICDIGCGDLYWISTMDLDGIDYYGYDWIRQETTCENLKKIRGKGKRVFVEGDISQYDNIFQADLMICRSVFVHMTNDMVLEVLKNLLRHKIRAKYLLASTSTVNTNQGRLKKFGHPAFARINMELDPFKFGKPIELFMETDTRKGIVGVWKAKNIKI